MEMSMENCSRGGTGQHHAAWIPVDDYIMAEMGDKWTMENVRAAASRKTGLR
jgi:hypothetical protein